VVGRQGQPGEQPQAGLDQQGTHRLSIPSRGMFHVFMEKYPLFTKDSEIK
jgi:hypothetical protein